MKIMIIVLCVVFLLAMLYQFDALMQRTQIDCRYKSPERLVCVAVIKGVPFTASGEK